MPWGSALDDRGSLVTGALLSRPVVSRHGIFFWLLRVLVRVRYTFFAIAILLGIRSPSVLALSVWVTVVFAAILLHEYGHALAAKFYRQHPQIELHAMGGTTTWTWIDELRWHQRVLIDLAGPGIGFAAAGLLYLGGAFAPIDTPYVLRLARFHFNWIAVAWGIFNLLPLLPMDGGQALAEVLERRLGAAQGRLWARRVSCVTGFAGLIAGFALDAPWAGLLCGIFAFDNLQRMRGLPGVTLPR